MISTWVLIFLSAANATNYFIEHALDIVENGCKEFAKFVARVQVNEFIEDYGPDYDDMAQGQLRNRIFSDLFNLLKRPSCELFIEYFEFLTEMSSEIGNKNMDICKVQDPDDLPMYSKESLLEGFLNFFAHDSDQSANIDCLSHIFANCEVGRKKRDKIKSFVRCSRTSTCSRRAPWHA